MVNKQVHFNIKRIFFEITHLL